MPVLVIFLLLDDAVEADGAPFKIRHARIPRFDAEAGAAMIRVDDVKPQKPEAIRILYDRDRGDGHIAQKPHDEAIRVGAVKRREIVESRIPALLRRPVDGGPEFIGGGRAYLEICHFATFRILADTIQLG